MNKIIILLWICTASIATAQTNLGRKITITANKQKISEVLQLLTKQQQVKFSYNPDKLPLDSTVTFTLTGATLQQVLQKTLGTGYIFVEAGEFVVIRKKTHTKKTASRPVKGYITDKQSGVKLKEVTVVELSNYQMTNSDNEGYYALNTNKTELELAVVKMDYRDTVIQINTTTDSVLYIPLTPKQKPDSSIAIASLKKYIKTHKVYTGLNKLFTSGKQRVMAENLKNFSMNKVAQVSFVPGIGTAGRKNTMYNTNLSLNVLGGINRGVNGIELGGIFNINRENVNGLQISGVSNIVNGNFNGVQLTQVYNHIGDTLQGVQLSSAINYARVVKGVQVGIVNIADSSAGVSIGLINIVKKGYHELELYTTDWSQMGMAFKTGTHHFYNIFKFGIFDFDKRTPYIGYGVGYSTQKGNSRLWFDFDLATHYSYDSFKENKLGLINSFDFTFSYRFLKTSWIYAGPSVNVYVRDATFTHANPSILNNAHEFGSAQVNTDLWVGYKAGVRF